jgi:hypothetical protein
MITSIKLQSLTTEEFCDFYRESVIQKVTEDIIEQVLYEQYYNKKQILKYNMGNIAVSYHIPIMNNLKTRFSVSSIYLINDELYIDWSLSA